MRTLILTVVVSAMALGCAARTPVAPETGMPSLATQQSFPSNDPHRLWGEYSLIINAAHDKVDVVPKREARFHLNALKFLESYCTDCMKITKIKNNGDGTIDLTVKIKHPFTGYPQYTGFDVKGILMFNGSMMLGDPDDPSFVEFIELFGMTPDGKISWRELGDPEVLNADGYTARWSPSYDSGQSAPIFNYWAGKYSSGVPTAAINAYLEFNSAPERHIFTVNSSVERTYKIYLPPGKPVVAGYAVEACWEPPTVLPVTNPLMDFPISANQPEAYQFKVIINNDEPIQVDSGCCGYETPGVDCSNFRIDVKFWEEQGPLYQDFFMSGIWGGVAYSGMGGIIACDPPYETCATNAGFDGDLGGPGLYRDVYILWHQDGPISKFPASRVSWFMCDRVVVP